MEIQIVCKNTPAEDLREALKEFGELDVTQQTGHVLISLTEDAPTAEILLECRKHAYAYLRITVWEEGGGLERTGKATCVAGVSGEPLNPLTLRDRGERANGKHALFGSRTGLVVAEARRQGLLYDLEVTEHRIEKFVLQDPRTVLNAQFETHVGDYLDAVGLEHDRYLPLLRAVLRKVDCMYCVHSHYRTVDGGTDE